GEPGSPGPPSAYATRENVNVCRTSRTARHKDSAVLLNPRFRFNTESPPFVQTLEILNIFATGKIGRVTSNFTAGTITSVNIVDLAPSLCLPPPLDPLRHLHCANDKMRQDLSA